MSEEIQEPPACTAVKRLIYADDPAAATAGELEAAAAALREGDGAAAAALLRNAFTGVLLLCPDQWPVELNDGILEAHGVQTRGFLLSRFSMAADAAAAAGSDAAAADAAGEDAAAAVTGGIRLPAAALRAALLRQWWHVDAVLTTEARAALDGLLERIGGSDPITVIHVALCNMLASVKPSNPPRSDCGNQNQQNT